MILDFTHLDIVQLGVAGILSLVILIVALIVLAVVREIFIPWFIMKVLKNKIPQNGHATNAVVMQVGAEILERLNAFDFRIAENSKEIEKLRVPVHRIDGLAMCLVEAQHDIQRLEPKVDRTAIELAELRGELKGRVT